MNRSRRLIIALGVLALAGCGRKGGLYLPDEKDETEDKSDTSTEDSKTE